MSKLGGAIFIATVAGIAMWFIQDKALNCTRYTVRADDLPESFNGKKILLISDLHGKCFGERYNNLINSCQACEPDYIFVVGDLISRYESTEFYDAKLDLMRELKKICPVYYSWGNHESDAGENAEYFTSMVKQMGIACLRNEKVYLTSGDDKIALYGLEVSFECFHNKTEGYSHLKEITTEYVTELLGENEDAFTLLMAHSPFGFESYAKWGADVVFSGHCHGGCVRLPFVGGLLSPERKFFPKYTKGLYYNDASTMVLSAGLGKFRYHNPSEIVLCTLEKRCTEKGNDENVSNEDYQLF